MDAVRFLQSFDWGRGDYNKERSRALDLTLDVIFRGIERRKEAGQKECAWLRNDTLRSWAVGGFWRARWAGDLRGDRLPALVRVHH